MSLGIESTAHTFGAALVEKAAEGNQGSPRILSDVRDAYRSPVGSGIHPREASRHHADVSSAVVGEAFRRSGRGISEVDFVAYSAGPGLGPCLRIGGVVARSIAGFFDKPIVAANHAIGHIELGMWLTELKDPLVLIVSGGHTLITTKVDGVWKIFGETLDLTLGQLLDQVGRFMGLSSPAGYMIERLAAENIKETFGSLLDLPYSIKGNDVSYSGLLSAAKDALRAGFERRRVCFALQEVAFSVVVEATERALAFTEKRELLVTGGVAANQRLVGMLGYMCADRNVKLGVIPREYAGDCGAQIAVSGFTLFEEKKIVSPEDAFVRQSWRIDQVKLR